MSFLPFPAGVIMPYSGPTTPNGWLFCDGQAYSRTTYAALFAAIGTTFGAGDGSTTFNVPNPLGRAVAVTGGGHAHGSTTGTETETISVSTMPQHNHSITDPGHTHPLRNSHTGGTGGLFDGTINGTNLTLNGLPISPGTQAVATNISLQNNGSGGSHTNMMPSLFLNHIIKT
jgi:microcystin-dependent protein